MKTTILAVTVLLFSTMMMQEVYAPFQASLQDPGVGGKAIPDWVKNQFEWYVNGEIDEKTLLTSMSWLVDNRVMFLSEKAAQEEQTMRKQINDLKQELEETKAAIAIPNLLEARKGANESAMSGFMKLGDIKGESDSSTGKMHIPLVLQINTQQKMVEDEIMVLLRPAPGATDGKQSFHVEVAGASDQSHKDWIIIESMSSPITRSTEKPTIAATTAGGTDDRPTEEVAFYYNKISFASKTVDDIMTKGGTSSAWKDGIASFSQQGMRESVVDDLQGIVVLCNTAIDKKSQKIDAELKMIEEWLKVIEKNQSSGTSYDAAGRITAGTTTESSVQYRESDLNFITRKLTSIDQQINSLDNGIKVLEEKLATIGDDAQLANMDLQNSLQKQQQTLQTMSNVSKMLHDTAMSVIRKIG